MSDEHTKAAPPEQAVSPETPTAATKPQTAEERKAAALAKAAAKKAELAAKGAADTTDTATKPQTAEERKAAAQAKRAESAAKGGGAASKAAAAKKSAPAKKPAARAKKAGATFERPKDVSRREFLNLAWLGSMALLTVQTLGVSVLFLFPRFKEGEFGGIFNLRGSASTLLPEKGGAPVPFTDGKFWLTNTDKGVYALYKVCTHLGCLYAWADITQRFECPCHGSKFALTGKYLAGPAPRSLDRFKIIATRPDGSVVETPPNGAGIQLNGDEMLAIDTGTRIKLSGRVEV